MDLSKPNNLNATELSTLRTIIHNIHAQNRNAGWWDKPREVGTMLCMVHSEVSEAMEGARKGINDDHLTHRPMLEVELADAVIRIFDMAGGLNLDVAGAISEKLAYNANRADHKRENREKDGGKRF